MGLVARGGGDVAVRSGRTGGDLGRLLAELGCWLGLSFQRKPEGIRLKLRGPGLARGLAHAIRLCHNGWTDPGPGHRSG
jgi:hypothetical protein